MRSYERNDVTVDQCGDCRGVFLDRGELDKVVERERQLLEHDDDDFMREMTGHRGGGQHGEAKYGFDTRTAEKIFDDYRRHKSHPQKRKKSFLEQILD